MTIEAVILCPRDGHELAWREGVICRDFTVGTASRFDHFYCPKCGYIQPESGEGSEAKQ